MTGRALMVGAILAIQPLQVFAQAQSPAGVTPSAAAVAQSVTLPAQILPYQSAILTAKVAGYLRAIRVDKGDVVKAGELIADIEVPELLADRTQYKAQLDVAQSEYNRVQQAIKTAPDLVTPQSVDEARGKLQVAQAQLDRTDTLLRYARITAPFSGTIVARYVDPGAYIPVASSSAQQSAAVVSLMDFSRVRVQIPIPENVAAKITRGTPAVITLKSAGSKPIPASVTRVSYAIDQSSQTMLAEIEIANPGGILRPGMYATVRLTVKP
jgi:membrane fusion protein (multidrug efflux system)